MLKRNKSFLFVLILLLVGWVSGAVTAPNASAPAGPTLRFTVLYDNYVATTGTQADWGFACLIEGAEKTILFDTGTKPKIFLDNLQALKVDLKKIDQLVISHFHLDHTGGLQAALEQNPNVMVFGPVPAPQFAKTMTDLGAAFQSVDKPTEICKHVYLTGVMGDQIKEQSLIVDTPQGLVILTGCSHQGIVNVLRRAKEILDKPIYLVFGGFHLLDKSDAEIKEIVAAFNELGVEQCGATHCTGDAATAAFKSAFGAKYLPMGTGKVIEVPGY